MDRKVVFNSFCREEYRENKFLKPVDRRICKRVFGNIKRLYQSDELCVTENVRPLALLGHGLTLGVKFELLRPGGQKHRHENHGESQG